MADEGVLVRVACDSAVKIVKWKVKDGAAVSSGQVLCLYEHTEEHKAATSAPGRCRAPRAGVVKVRAGEGNIVQPGEAIAQLEQCKHTTVMKEMCAECGADLRQDESAGTTTPAAMVPMVHSVPELKVTEELARKLGREDCERLLRDRKLALLVDLDQTLVHTTNENVPNNMKNVLHFFLRGPGGGRWYHTRLRPGTQAFLQSAATKYELHVCTFGVRQYAHAVASLLDPAGVYFSHRILSRDECFDARTKSANLKALFPCGDDMVCIIDDREDVWRHASNLIHVRPYCFFQSTGDINAPPPPDEKGKLISGKNGSQISSNPEMEMPSLDSDPPSKDPNQTDDGANGKIKPKQDSSKVEENSDSTNEAQENSVTSKKVEEKEEEAKWKETEDGMIDVEDPDDYLIYLEDILHRIHTAFYTLYDSMEAGQSPDLKAVIPAVRARVLAGASLVFSGLVPQHAPLEASRAYQVARSLGAEVTADFTPQTTHLLAVRPGTVKVNVGRRLAAGDKPPHLVTPDWLWACAERWEHVDERLYPLQRTASSARRPPPHCSSPPPPPAAAARRRTPSGRFMDTLNPLLSFSSADIADMDKEVEDICNESDESDSDDDIFTDERLVGNEETESQDKSLKVEDEDSSSNASGDSLTGDSADRPRKRRRADAEAEPPDDDSWSLMGAALEREFLGLQ